MSNEERLDESVVGRFKVLAGIKTLQEQVLPTGPIPEDVPMTMGAPIPGLEKAPPGLPRGLMGGTPSTHQVKAGQGYWHVAKALGLPPNSRTYRELRDLVRGGVGRGSTVLKTSMVFEKAPDGSISVSRPGSTDAAPRPSATTQPDVNPFARPVLFPDGGTTDIADVEGGLTDPELLPPGDRIVRRGPEGFEEVSSEELAALQAQERREKIRRNSILRYIDTEEPAAVPNVEDFFQQPETSPDPTVLNQLYQDLVAPTMQSAPEQPMPPTPQQPMPMQPSPLVPVLDPNVKAREREMVLQYPDAYPAAFNKLVADQDPDALRVLQDPVTDEMLKQIGIEENQEKIVDKIADILIEYLSEK
jgi:hypothetical protein